MRVVLKIFTILVIVNLLVIDYSHSENKHESAALADQIDSKVSGINGDSILPCGKIINIRDFAKEKDPNETAAIQAALNLPGVCQVYFPPGKYRLQDTLVVPAGIRVITSSEQEPRRAQLVQKVEGRPIFRITSSASGLTISRLFFDGIGGNISASHNAAILVLGGSEISSRVSGIKVIDNHFQGFRQHPITVYHGNNITVENNFFYRNAGAVSLGGVVGGIVSKNQIRESNLPQGEFKVGIRLESRDCTVSGEPGYDCDVSRDLTISQNIIESLGNSQAILVHSGVNISIEKNVIRDCTIGISANAYLASDSIEDLSMIENTFVGLQTSIADAEPAGSVEINLGADIKIREVVITRSFG